MKILLVITAWGFGGAEIQVKALATKFIEKKHDVLIVSMIKPDFAFLKINNPKNIAIKTLNMTRGVPSLSAIFKLKKIIQQFNPNVVHAHMVHAVILSRISRIFVKMPKLISTAHNTNEGSKIRELAYRFTDFLSDINTNVSQNAIDLYIEKKIFKKEKSFVMPNGIELVETKNYAIEHKNNTLFRKTFNIPEDTFIWLAVGRLTEAKDYTNMLNAIALITDKNFIVLIAGDGELKELLTKQIKDKHIESHVKLLGLRDDIDYLMQNANAFILSSAWEGVPIVVLEAQNIGLPVLATKVGACEQLITNSDNGFIVPIKDSIALKNGMLDMMSCTTDERIAMGEKTIKTTRESYEINSIANKWLQVYNT